MVYRTIAAAVKDGSLGSSRVFFSTKKPVLSPGFCEQHVNAGILQPEQSEARLQAMALSIL